MLFWPKSAPVILTLALFMAGAGCRNASSLSANTQAPPFTLKDLSGKTVSLSDYKGKPVLLDFWATWCGPCMISTPVIQRLYEKYKADGFTVLGLNMDDDPAPVYAFVKRFAVTYPVLYASNSPAASDYGLEGLPLFILVDQQGRMVQRYSGFGLQVIESLDEEVGRLVAAGATTAPPQKS